MASQSCLWTDNPYGPLFPLNSTLIKPISDEDFISFHFIDRELFSQLIFDHGRDVIESMQVMAFWLWLEKDGYCPMKLVFKILHELPPHMVSQVADETVVCLKCIEDDRFIYSVSEGDQEILLLQSLMEEKRLSLVQLHENRMNILSMVGKIAEEICYRAFKDILEIVFRGPGSVVNDPNRASSSGTSNRYHASTNMMPSIVNDPNRASSSGTSNRYHASTNMMPPPPPPVMGIPVYQGQVVGYMAAPTRYLDNDGSSGSEAGGGGHEMPSAIGVPNQRVVHPPNQMVVPPPNHQVMLVPRQGPNRHFNPYDHLQHQQGEPEMEMLNSHFNPYHDPRHQQGGEQDHFINPYNLRLQQQLEQMEFVNRELGERMSHFRISEFFPEEERIVQQVPADDRTIFLTFSKGYPISENEVREFFTRKYGDFIEGIYMQEVAPEEQSLFASVVCHDAAVIDRVAPMNSKAKFSINGKHVWARKYVKKNTTRPPLQSSDAGPSHS